MACFTRHESNLRKFCRVCARKIKGKKHLCDSVNWLILASMFTVIRVAFTHQITATLDIAMRKIWPMVDRRVPLQCTTVQSTLTETAQCATWHLLCTKEGDQRRGVKKGVGLLRRVIKGLRMQSLGMHQKVWVYCSLFPFLASFPLPTIYL